MTHKYAISLLLLLVSCKESTKSLFNEIVNNPQNSHLILIAKVDSSGNTNNDESKNRYSQKLDFF